jgi:putative effector of murein hydrolase LrgA (UPF0299 family)
MNDRRRFGRIFFVPAGFGLVSLFNVLGRPSLQAVRAVDIVQLISTGMCFGAAIMLLALFFRSSGSQ